MEKLIQSFIQFLDHEASAVIVVLALSFTGYSLVREYLKNRKEKSCPKCLTRKNVKLLSKKVSIEDEKQNLRVFTYQYQCSSCHHIWYSHKDEKINTD